MRGTAIAVSDDEKRLLDEVAREEFGTEDVAYGAVVSALCSNYLGGIEDSDKQNDN